jgi:hypothetical protein
VPETSTPQHQLYFVYAERGRVAHRIEGNEKLHRVVRVALCGASPVRWGRLRQGIAMAVNRCASCERKAEGWECQHGQA